jgi:hypothetical protein
MSLVDIHDKYNPLKQRIDIIEMPDLGALGAILAVGNTLS